MEKLISSLMLFISLSSFAQFSLPLHLAHNGGNGGDDDEIMIKNTLLQIGVFLDSSDGRILFQNDVDSKLFLATIKNVDIRVVDQKLVDKFEMNRCALNFPESQLVVFKRACLDNLRKNVNDLYVLLTHEIFNLMGLELPDEKGGSVYQISTRIGAIGALVIAKSKDTLFSPHCQLDVIDWNLTSWKVPRLVQNVLQDKGFVLVKSSMKDLFSPKPLKDRFYLMMSIEAEKYSGYKIIGNKIIFLDRRAELIESSFLQNKYNGLITLRIQGTEIRTYAPTPVRVQTWGEQYNVEPKGFWKESIFEAFMKLPSCVKY
jgi:hypothetical protein